MIEKIFYPRGKDVVAREDLCHNSFFVKPGDIFFFSDRCDGSSQSGQCFRIRRRDTLPGTIAAQSGWRNIRATAKVAGCAGAFYNNII